MKEVKIFENPEFGSVRTVMIDNEPWFVGKDVAQALGYSNTRDALNKHVDTEDKGVAKCDTPGGSQEMTVINESGVYALVFGSKLDSAKRFKHWVTSEVLPSIRKTGGYHVPQTYAEALRALADKAEEAEKLAIENKAKDQIIGELKPKADYTDVILSSRGAVTITQIAKDYGLSGKVMNQKLHELGIQYKQNNQWLLYSEYQDKGYTKSETVSITFKNGEKGFSMSTKWTQKGRLFLYEELKKINILPVIEQ